MLKADLHMHVNDPEDWWLKHTPKQLIDAAAKQGFEVLAITNHNNVFYDKSTANYAKKKGILMIPGIELTIKSKHVLAYNITQAQAGKIKTFDDLRKIKSKKNLIIAPHPFYPHPQFVSLKDEFRRNIDVFDAVEYCHFYLSFYNPNKKSIRAAKKYLLPLIGNSDLHYLHQLSTTYTLINSEKTIPAVIHAIKKGKVTVISRPLSIYRFVWRLFNTLYENLKYTQFHK